MQDEISQSDPNASDDVSRNEENDSGMATGSPKSRSVYDFLYHDARRVGSFLAQFEDHGVAGSVKASASAGQVASDRKQFTGSLGLPGLMRGQGSLEVGVSAEERDTTEKTYDPFWNNAIRFLDLINDASLLQRDLFSALLGQIVLVKGNLVVIDPSMIKDCYKISVIPSFFKLGVSALRVRSQVAKVCHADVFPRAKRRSGLG